MTEPWVIWLERNPQKSGANLNGYTKKANSSVSGEQLTLLVWSHACPGSRLNNVCETKNQS